MADDGLVAFLRARLDEDAALAIDGDSRRNGTGPWARHWAVAERPLRTWGDDEPDVVIAGGKPLLAVDPEYAGSATAEFVAAFDPARVLAEVDAKRRIMAIHQRRGDFAIGGSGWMDDACDGCGYSGICDDPDTEHIDDCPILRALAVPYAQHPAYREEWKP